jgi:hypothetical protein
MAFGSKPTRINGDIPIAILHQERRCPSADLAGARSLRHAEKLWQCHQSEC